jgi:hypothetical protein
VRDRTRGWCAIAFIPIYPYFAGISEMLFYFWGKTRQEQSIAASQVEWVIVRPVALTNADGRGVYCHGSNIGSFFWTARIARADVAHFMLKQLTDDSYLGRAVGVCW